MVETGEECFCGGLSGGFLYRHHTPNQVGLFWNCTFFSALGLVCGAWIAQVDV